MVLFKRAPRWSKPLYGPWLPLPFFLLLIVVLPKWAIYVGVSVYYKKLGHRYFLGHSDFNVWEEAEVPSWIIYKLPLFHLTCLVISFNHGRAMAPNALPRDAHPKAIVRYINANISNWISSSGNLRSQQYACNETIWRRMFTRYLVMPRWKPCTDFLYFGLLTAVWHLSSSAAVITTAPLAYICLVGEKLPGGEPKSTTYRNLLFTIMALVYVLLFGMTVLDAQQVGWSLSLGRFGRKIRERAFQADWDLEKEFESPEEQLKWWESMILDESSHGYDTEITEELTDKKIDVWV